MRPLLRVYIPLFSKHVKDAYLMTMKYILPIFFLLSATLLVAPASAQRIGAGNDPIYVSSDAFEGTESQGVWTGNVRIVQGKAILVADRVVGDLDGNGGIDVITATGSVRYSDGEQAIGGTTGVYQEKARTLTISGNVIVTQGKNVFTANKVIYWLDTGRVEFTPLEGDRIRGRIFPGTDINLGTPG